MSIREEIISFIKKSAMIFLIFVLMCFIIIISYHLDVIFLEFYPHYISKKEKLDYIESFSAYRDFVVVITGLLTCIIGFTAAGSYITYKRSKSEEEKLVQTKKVFDILLDVQRMNLISYNYDTEMRVDIFSKLNDTSDSSILTLKGDAYYDRGKIGDFLIAKDSYEKAISLNSKNAQALFGLARSIYKINYSEKLDKLGLSDKFLKDEEYENEDENDKKDSNNERDEHYIDISKSTKLFIKQNLPKNADDFKGLNLEEVLKNFQMSIGYGYSKQLVYFEMGQMLFDCYSFSKALEYYTKAYDVNNFNLKVGFFYSKTWIIVHIDKINKLFDSKDREKDFEKLELYKIIDILNKIGIVVPELSSSAYALLWYLYAAKGDNIMSERSLQATNQFVINDLFTIKK